MGFGMFSAKESPIAIDFGTSSVKLLQIGAGDRPPLLAAAELPVPDSIRGEPERVHAFYAEWLPKTFADARFKGKRAVIAIPSSQAFIQHMQITDTDGVSRDDAIKGQLQMQMNVSPHNVVVRSMEVGPVNRNGEIRTEMICFAIAKDTVMRYVDLLKRFKLEVVGVHTEMMAMVRAFDHLNRRAEDENTTTLYVDLGWGGTRVAITHGNRLMFARYVAIGGRHFDQLIAQNTGSDLAAARAYRLSLQGTQQLPTAAAAAASRPALNAAASAKIAASAATAVAERRTGAAPPELRHTLQPGRPDVDLSELLDTISDELCMGLRYHQGLFKGRPIDRAIFVGAESKQTWLTQHVVKALRVPAQLGDPLARFETSSAISTPGLTLGQPQPSWAVVCGLCTAPTDL